MKQNKTIFFILQFLGWLFVLLCWGLVLVHQGQLPPTIPTHFNALGEADDYSDKSMIFLLPTLLTVLYTALTLLSRHPQTFNYPVALTEANKAAQQLNARYLLATIQLALAIVFTLLTYFSMRAAIMQQAFIPIWLLPLALALFFIPILFFVLRARKLK